MLLGMVGGALGFAWVPAPARQAPEKPATRTDESLTAVRDDLSILGGTSALGGSQPGYGHTGVLSQARTSYESA